MQNKHIDRVAYLWLSSYPAPDRKKNPNLVSNSVLLQPHWALVLMGYTVPLCLCTCSSLYLEHSFTRFMLLAPVFWIHSSAQMSSLWKSLLRPQHPYCPSPSHSRILFILSTSSVWNYLFVYLHIFISLFHWNVNPLRASVHTTLPYVECSKLFVNYFITTQTYCINNFRCGD